MRKLNQANATPVVIGYAIEQSAYCRPPARLRPWRLPRGDPDAPRGRHVLHLRLGGHAGRRADALVSDPRPRTLALRTSFPRPWPYRLGRVQHAGRVGEPQPAHRVADLCFGLWLRAARRPARVDARGALHRAPLGLRPALGLAGTLVLR